MASMLWSRKAMNSVSSPKRRTSWPLSFSAAPRMPKFSPAWFENLRRGSRDRLHPVVVGGNAVDEIQRVRAVLPSRILTAQSAGSLWPLPSRPSSSPSCRTDCRGSPAPSAAFAGTGARCRRRPCRAADRRSCRCTRPAADIPPRRRRTSCTTRSHPRNRCCRSAACRCSRLPNTG